MTSKLAYKSVREWFLSLFKRLRVYFEDTRKCVYTHRQYKYIWRGIFTHLVSNLTPFPMELLNYSWAQSKGIYLLKTCPESSFYIKAYFILFPPGQGCHEAPRWRSYQNPCKVLHFLALPSCQPRDSGQITSSVCCLPHKSTILHRPWKSAPTKHWINSTLVRKFNVL